MHASRATTLHPLLDIVDEFGLTAVADQRHIGR